MNNANVPYWDSRYARQGRGTVGHVKFSPEELDRKTKMIGNRFGASFAKYFADRRVLDFGCGYGRMSKLLMDAGAGDVHGVDISVWAVKDALAYEPRASFFLYDGHTLPFPDRHFNAAFTWTALQHVMNDNIKATVAEIARVTAPGSPLMIYENTSQKPDSTYIWFRPAGLYIGMFAEHGFAEQLTQSINWIDETDEMHTLIVMEKIK